jgi:hypothetical protein
MKHRGLTMAEHSRGQDNAESSATSSRSRAAGDIVNLGRLAARTIRLAAGNDNRRPSAQLVQIALVGVTALFVAALIAVVLL